MNRLSRRGVHAQVVDLLGQRIIRGEVKPGEVIDLERLLQELQVSRTVLREAIKVLSEKGLLGARPRHGTYVTEREEWQLIDEDVMTWRSSGDPDPLLVHELGELRQIFEPAAARLAALRRTDIHLADMAHALERMRENVALGDTETVIESDIAFHRAVLAATGNELLARFEVMLEAALHARNRLTLEENKDVHFVDQHALVYEAILHGDPSAAQTEMARLMDEALDDAAEIIKRSGG